MTTVEDIGRIRWAHFREGVSVKELARRLHKTRNTIRRTARDAALGEWRVRRPAPRSMMDRLVPVAERWLDKDRAGPRKRWLTAPQLYQRPREGHGFSVGESTVGEQRQTSLAKVTLRLMVRVKQRRHTVAEEQVGRRLTQGPTTIPSRCDQDQVRGPAPEQAVLMRPATRRPGGSGWS